MASARRASYASGAHGAAATAHPAATAAATRLLAAGGTAVDAAIAAQAVICVVMPQAAGLGGDLLALVHHDGTVDAVNGTGLSPRGLTGPPQTSGGTAVTIPGLVDGWMTLHDRWGRLPLARALEPAIELADNGFRVDTDLCSAVDAQLTRLRAGGASEWNLLDCVAAGAETLWRQPALADLLARITTEGRGAFYTGSTALAIVDAVRQYGGVLDLADLAGHETLCPATISAPWQDGTAFVQPPASQGVLLAMALQKCAALERQGHRVDDHVLVEITEAVFAHRSECASGSALLAERLDVDLHRAAHRGGPRAYLHTAGVAVADAGGAVVSSLISVFDDFGSGVFVPELGVVLNNRAAGFTEGANAPGPAKRPVHTLAPAIVTSPGRVLAIATPGADGQIQTLLQTLAAERTRPLVDAVTAPRWRSQDGDLLIEDDYPAADELAARGHRIVRLPPGSDVFGAVVAAGIDPDPFAVADWRRLTHSAGVP